MTNTLNIKKITEEELQLMIKELQAGRMHLQSQLNLILQIEEILFASMDEALLDEVLIMDQEELNRFIDDHLLNALVNESFSKTQAQLLAKLYELLFDSE